MKTYIGADHRGFALKEKIKEYLKDQKYEVVDLGNDHYDENDDHPDFARAVADQVSKDPKERRGILLCGSGVGVDVLANKFKGVKSALVFDEKQAYLSRNDDDTNVLSLAADFITEQEVQKILDVWLKTPFSGEEKYKRRLEKIENLEKSA